MTSQGRQPLKNSLALAAACLRGAAVAQAFGGAVEDPLRLNLPPLLGPGGVDAPDPAALRVIAALYLQAELEQAGVIPMAEMLAEARARLDFGTSRLAVKLEEFARRSRDWLDRPRRAQLFARLFGMGAAAVGSEGSTINRDFQQRFAALCLALVRYSESFVWGQTPGAAREAALRQEATNLLVNLGPRQFGNTLIAGRLVQEQLQQAVELLKDPELGSYFQARGLWEVLRRILCSMAPDLGRLVTRGQTGLQILNWLASIARQLNEPAGPLLVAPGAPVFTWAAAWLEATGVEVPRLAKRRVA